ENRAPRPSLRARRDGAVCRPTIARRAVCTLRYHASESALRPCVRYSVHLCTVPIVYIALLHAATSWYLLFRGECDNPRAGREAVEIVGPRLHHPRPLREPMRAVVDAPDAGPRVRELALDHVAVPPELVQERRRRRAETVRAVLRPRVVVEVAQRRVECVI